MANINFSNLYPSLSIQDDCQHNIVSLLQTASIRGELSLNEWEYSAVEAWLALRLGHGQLRNEHSLMPLDKPTRNHGEHW